jgi:hypothetical protein
VWLTEPDGPGWWFVVYYGEIEVVKVADNLLDFETVGYEAFLGVTDIIGPWMRVTVPAVPRGA